VVGSTWPEPLARYEPSDFGTRVDADGSRCPPRATTHDREKDVGAGELAASASVSRTPGRWLSATGISVPILYGVSGLEVEASTRRLADLEAEGSRGLCRRAERRRFYGADSPRAASRFVECKFVPPFREGVFDADGIVMHRV